jgi:hypothetical protein
MALKLCDNNTIAVGTVAGGAVQEPFDVRLAALWQHDGAVSYLQREYRVSLINEASKSITAQADLWRLSDDD